MASVTDVERSIAFYAHLGFEVGNTFTPQDATKVSWAWLHSGEAQIMISKASEPIPDQHSVLFYIYTENVTAAHESLTAAGLNPAEIKIPFYSPRGEFQLVDPDGYILMITHT
jgi:predicted enzyme related to lactoylglutathione lyase